MAGGKIWKYKGSVIRLVTKAGQTGYDTTHSLIIWPTLAEAKRAIGRHVRLKEVEAEARAARQAAEIERERMKREAETEELAYGGE